MFSSSGNTQPNDLLFVQLIVQVRPASYLIYFVSKQSIYDYIRSDIKSDIISRALSLSLPDQQEHHAAAKLCYASDQNTTTNTYLAMGHSLFRKIMVIGHSLFEKSKVMDRWSADPPKINDIHNRTTKMTPAKYCACLCLKKCWTIKDAITVHHDPNAQNSASRKDRTISSWVMIPNL